MISSTKERIRRILHLGDSPQRTATAFAVGVFIAFTPTYGLHFVTALLCSWLFRLNFLALVAGTLINNPWTVLPIIGSSMWLGLLLDPVGPPPNIDWIAFNSLMWLDKFHVLWNYFYPYLVPFVVGHLLLGIVGAVIGYLLLYQAVVRFREHQARMKHLAPPPSS